MPYAADCGLVYAECSVSTDVRQCQCLKLAKPRFQPSPNGAPSMRKIAIRTLLRNLDVLEIDSVRNLPLHIVGELWKEVCKLQLNTLPIWQIFAHSALGKKSFIYTSTEGVRCPLHDVLSGQFIAARHSGPWLTNLTLAAYVSREDLANIAKLPNLRNFHLHAVENSAYIFTDHTVHSWAEAAKGDGGLARLEMIFVAGQRGVTLGSLHHLNAFPRLDTFCLYRSGIYSRSLNDSTRKTAKELGWSTSGLGFKRYVSSKAERAPRTWPDIVDGYIAHRRLSSDEVDDCPAMNLTLGTPTINYFYDIDNIVCFERDWRPAGPSVVPPASPANPNLSKHVPKKRKVKDGRAIALNNLLQDI